MASLNGVSSSNTISSLYNSANTISGLASGLDTEGMIENLVKGYQTKINQLNQKITKTEWKQDSYRSIINKLVGFGSKYTSYSSSTNLLSPNFFHGAVNVTTQGIFGDRVSASGKTSSDVSLDAVKQLAKAAQYRTAGNLKTGDGSSIEAAKGLDLNGKVTLGALSGSLTVTYGGNNITLNFDEVADKEALEEIKAANGGKAMSEGEALAALINRKLEGQTITFSNGSGTAKAEDRIEVRASGNQITFKDKSSGGNAVYISKASGNVAKTLGLEKELENAKETKPSTIKLGSNFKTIREEDTAAYLSGKTMTLSVDGSSKTITMPKITESNGKYKLWDSKESKWLDYNAENYTKLLGDSLQTAFKGKVNVSNEGENGELKLRFEVQEGSNLVVNTDVGEALGIGRAATSYLNTGKTLKDLLGSDGLSGLTPARDDDGKLMTDSKGKPMYALTINGEQIGAYSENSTLAEIMDDINKNKDAGVKVSYSQTTKNFLFSATDTGAESRIDMGAGLAQKLFGSTADAGKLPGRTPNAHLQDILGGNVQIQGSQFSVNVDGKDVSFEFVGNNPTVENVRKKLEDTLNAARPADDTEDYKVSLTENGTLSVTKGGKESDISYNNGIAKDLFEIKSTFTAGQDAEFTVTVNGETINMKRSSNTVNIDGLSITMKDTFNGAEDADGKAAVDSAGRPRNSVTFKSTTDSDKIVDAIKAMIEDYNAMMSEIKSAYSTMPYQKSNGTFANYEPLTDDEREGMSESAIERYEEKAKQGILFGDRTLSSMYDRMRDIFSPAGNDGGLLRAMGITTSYSDGLQTISLDEGKLRSMLESDPEAVADVFTRTNGGVMQNLKNQLDNYARTTGEPKGILIQQAGSPLSSLSLMSNTWQKQIDNYNTQIEKWQDKLSSQVDRYTQQFSRLEQLINQMNSQSSALAGLMGG